MADFKLDEFLPYQIAVLARRLSEGLAQTYAEPFQLSVADWRVLAHLHDAGLCSVREIARDADMEKSRVSRAVARLEGRGLIARAADGTDKRLLALKLTASGSAMVEKILPHASDYAEALFARLDDPKAFRDGLAQLLAASAIEK